MLRRMVYDYEREPDDDPNERRARVIALHVLIALAALSAGLAIGFAIDYLQGRILR